MSIYLRTRTDDVRALARAIALGSSAGLLVGAVYLAGSAATPRIPSTLAATASHGEIIRPQPSSIAAASGMAPVGPRAALRDRFGLATIAAQPFRFQQVADAPSDLHCLTEAVYFEARGETPAGQQAVAQVVLNRVRHPDFPKTICAVVHQRVGADCQFSFACGHEAALEPAAWSRAQRVASGALHGAVMAAVGDATHFQTARSGTFSGLMKVAQIGAHIFYRLGGREGAASMFHQSPKPSSLGVELARLDTHVSPATGPSSSAAGAAPSQVSLAGNSSSPSGGLAVVSKPFATPISSEARISVTLPTGSQAPAVSVPSKPTPVLAQS